MICRNHDPAGQVTNIIQAGTAGLLQNLYYGLR